MSLVWVKKLICVLSLGPIGLSAEGSDKPAEALPPQELEEIHAENDLSGLEARFGSDTLFDPSQVHELIKMRLIELGSLTPMKKNIDAMLILWDAGMRDPHVFMAALLKDTSIDQTVISHLYGPKTTDLLNEMKSNDKEVLSQEAHMIVDAFDAVEQV